MTITINGRTYNVEVHPEGDVLNPDMVRYSLHGPRAIYCTIRNQKTPHLMFVVPKEGRAFRGALSRVWLSDKTGELRQVLVR